MDIHWKPVIIESFKASELKYERFIEIGTIPTRARNFFPPCFIFYINMYVGLNDER